MNLIDAIFLFLVMSVLALLPSTSVALVVTRAATAGFSHGAAVAAGIVLGDLIFACLAILGMTAIAELMGGFFVIIKYAAGIYLIWLGLSLLKSKDSSLTGAIHRSSPSLSVSFFSGLFVTLSDMKAIFFYASLFPVFVDLSRISASDIALIFILTLLSVGGVKLGYAYGARKVVAQANGLISTRKIKVVGGSLMIGAGTYLIVKA